MSDTRQDTPDSVHEHGHRASVGGLWDEIGRLQFEFLLQQGLRATDVLVDIACGSLRGGVHAIQYLNPGNYLGLDKRVELVIYGVMLELGTETYRAKRPRFVISDSFEFAQFDRRPNFAIGQSIFTHLTADDMRLCLERLRLQAAHGCRFFATFNEVENTHHNPVKSHAHDLFYYTRAEMAALAAAADWEFHYMAEWGHPRGGPIVEFRVPNDGIEEMALAPPFENLGGFNWVIKLSHLPVPRDSAEAPRQSPLRLFENDRELGPAHSLHAAIRDAGQGRFSFWNGALYFATSDGSDPNTNGRSYRVQIPRAL